jgi:hypothetical protein
MKLNNESGQTLFEYLIVIIIILFLSLSIIEISRLYAFKNYLQILTHDTASKISHSHLYLLKNNLLDDKIKNNKLDKEIKKNIELNLNHFMTSQLSFDFNKNNSLLYLNEHNISLNIEFINRYNELNTPGVYIKINSCLPVLFSGFFRNYLYQKKNLPQIGKKVNEKIPEDNSASRNCLGYYSSNSIWTPLFWFRVRASSFFPWPASSSIYQKGFAVPNKFYGLEEDLNQSALQAIQNNNLTLFFQEYKKEF